MGKPDLNTLEMEKKRRMRNNRKKHRRQQRSFEKHAAAANVIARKIDDGINEQKIITAKYEAKCRNLCKEVRKLRSKIPIQSHRRKVKTVVLQLEQ